MKFSLLVDSEPGADHSDGTGLSEPSTAPPQEIIYQRKQTPSINKNDASIQLVEKQIELVNEKMKLQKVLLQTALIAQEEAKERLNLTRIQRKIADIDLHLKENELVG